MTALDADLLGGEVALGQLWCSLFTLTFAAESKWKCFVLILYNGPFQGFFNVWWDPVKEYSSILPERVP